MSTDLQNTRQTNYDLLRVIAMIAVIAIHVSDIWIGGFSNMISEGFSPDALVHPFAACIQNTLPRFAVPCFLMLSGAFIISNPENKHYAYFYRKSFLKIGIPSLIFTVLYFFYRLPFCFTGNDVGLPAFLILLKDMIKGTPVTPMWYVYMLIGVYLLAPVVILFKDSISEKAFHRTAFLFLMWACVSHWTTVKIRLKWDIGQSFEYLSYFIVGFSIRKLFSGQPNNKKGLLLIFLGFLLEFATAFAELHFHVLTGTPVNDLRYAIVAPFAPSIVLASTLIFAGFTLLRIPENRLIHELSRISFFVYLIHTGILDFITKLFHLFMGPDYIYRNLNNLIWIPSLTLIVLLFSIAGSYIYLAVYSRVERRIFMKRNSQHI